MDEYPNYLKGQVNVIQTRFWNHQQHKQAISLAYGTTVGGKFGVEHVGGVMQYGGSATSAAFNRHDLPWYSDKASAKIDMFFNT